MTTNYPSYQITFGLQHLSAVRTSEDAFKLSDVGQYTVRCFRCGFDSHTQKNCPLARCQRCRQYGHHHKLCHKLSNSSQFSRSDKFWNDHQDTSYSAKVTAGADFDRKEADDAGD